MQPQVFLPLFCKPRRSRDVIFKKYLPDLQCSIAFRSLQLQDDLEMIHQWVNLPYASEFWQMNGPFSQLYAIYQCMEINPFAHSFIGMMKNDTDEDSVICQFDVYTIMADELRDHLDAGPHDCGFHLLMAPNDVPVPGLTCAVIKSFLSYYFSFAEASVMYAEPDKRNDKSIALLEECGFGFIKEAEMSYKSARLYCISREQFLGCKKGTIS